MSGKVSSRKLAIAIPLIVAGVGGFVYTLVTGLGRMTENLQRLEVPGAGTMTLEPGDYTIYWEKRSSWGTRGRGPEVDVRITAPDGRTGIAVARTLLLNSNYQTEGRAGNSTATFTIDTAGAYFVSAKAPAGQTLPGGGIAVGKSLGVGGLLKIVFGGLASMALGLVPGILILVREWPPSSAPAA